MKMSPRTLLLNTIEEMITMWQDGLPSEAAVRARLNEVLTVEALGAPGGILVDSLDEIRQSMIDEALATFKLCCTIASMQ